MYTFKIVDGDIAVRGDGSVAKLSGAKRLEQELACWILEPLGTDRIYTRFGSTIGEMVGSPAVEEYLTQIHNEVERVVNNYMTYQRNQIEGIRNSSLQDAVDSWGEDDIISAVNSIEVEAMADTVRVTVTLTTEAGYRASISQTI